MNSIVNENKVEDNILKYDLLKLFKNIDLDNRSINILLHRNSWYYNKGFLLSELSKIYNVTIERIRQIQNNTLRKIRQSEEIKQFENYMISPYKFLTNIKNYKEKIKL